MPLDAMRAAPRCDRRERTGYRLGVTVPEGCGDAKASAPAEHPAFVLSLSPTGLAVARSLAPRGVRVLGVDPVRTEIGHFSRYVERDARIARAGPGPELADRLLEVAAEQPARPLLYAASDPFLEFACAHHERLRERFILPECLRPEGAARLADKRSFYARCASLGVALPPTFFPEDREQAREAASRLRYPAIVKPTQPHRFRRRLRGGKLVEVDGPRVLLEWWERLRAWGGESVLQESIPGPETNLFVAGLYVDAQGTCRSLFTARKSRQYPPRYGSGSYMEACWAEEIATLSLELVRGLRYRGICGTEYKWDPRDEAWKLIELNPRPTLWFALPPAAGVDIVWDAHCDLCGEPNQPHLGTQRDGVRWQLPVRDLLAGLHFWRRGELSALEFLRTVVDPRGKCFGDVSLRDPATLLGVGVDAVAKYLTHVRAHPARESSASA
jgi:predicted ATP-grasp superfamily ATP-dependent carboligase